MNNLSSTARVVSQRLAPTLRGKLMLELVHAGAGHPKPGEADPAQLPRRHVRRRPAADHPGGAPTRQRPGFGKLLDLQILLIGGRERTEPQYRALLDDSGYELTRVLETASPLHIIEAIAR